MDRHNINNPFALSRGARRLLAVTLVLLGFMLANTAYLLLNRLADHFALPFFAAGQTALPAMFQLMLLSHTGIGLLTALLFIGFAGWHLRVVWRRRRWKTLASGLAVIAAWIILAASGLFVLSEAASRNNAWVWWLHVAVAGVVPIGYLLHRMTATDPPPRRAYTRFAGATVAVLAAAVVVHSLTDTSVQITPEARLAIEQGLDKGPGARNRNVADYLDADFVPAAFVPPSSPFFPSAMTTNTGNFLPVRLLTRNEEIGPETFAADLEEYGFVVNRKIGAESCARCHADIVEQWSHSVHRFASFNNPFYEATINDMRKNATESNRWVDEHVKIFTDAADRIGMVRSKWCAGCHDPALLMTGLMDKPVNRASTEAQVGLACLACHNIDKIHNNTGNAAFNIADEQEDPYLFAYAEDGLGAWLHDTVLKAKPTVHKRQMRKDFFGTSEYCSACHKVNLDVPVNNYRWLRGQNEYDNWHDSGVAHNAARTFYLPPAVRTCQDCHMPLEPAVLGDVSAKNGMVRSHRFHAVNTALPFVRGDDDAIARIEQFLREDKLRVDVFAVRAGDAAEPVMAADHSRPPLIAGRPADIDVVVRNLGVGHTFPGGTNDSNEGWLEVTVRDEDDRVLFASGLIGDDGHLDPEAHMYKALMLDKHGNPIHRRNAHDIHVPVFVRVIGPGTADVGHFTFDVPPTLAGRQVTIRARLLWRKFDRAYTEFAYKTNPVGFKRFDDVPNLPVTEIASSEVQLPVLPPGTDTKIAMAALPEEWMRFNDYGIGLLLEGNTRAAARAFGMVRQLDPNRIDGHRNLARVAIQDGALASAFEHLRACEAIKPADPQTAWFWGVALQEDGRYLDAAAAYRRVLERFPKDRAAWRNLGRSLYLHGDYEEALAALDEVLAIDPEDRIAHYHQMLCHRALGRQREAEISRQAYEKYQIDESAQQITQAFRLAHPGANLQAQAIPVHVLKPAEPVKVAQP